MGPLTVRIRQATAADIGRLAAIAATDPLTTWGRETLAHELDVAGSHVDLVEEGSSVVSFMVWRHAAGEIELLEIVTHAEHRRQGLAKALMQRLFAQAVALGVRRIMLEVRRGNAPARSLYAALGFVVVGERPRYYADQEDAILMDCRLPAV